MHQHHDFLSLAVLDGKRMHGGVYAIEHIPSGRRLIARTACLAKRIHDQWRYLSRHQHYNPALQADVEADGADAFRFVLLAVCNDPHQIKLLKRWHVQDSRAKGITLYNAQDGVPTRLLLPQDWCAPQPPVEQTGGDQGSLHIAQALQRLDQLKRLLKAVAV